VTGEIAREARVISDWSGVLIHALSQGDRARAAKAAATIAEAARAASLILDPLEAISPAVTSSNGRYVTPEGGGAPIAMTGRIVRAEFSRGDDGRSGNCSNCSCELHDDALPSGTYITVKLEDGAAPVGAGRVTVTEASDA